MSNPETIAEVQKRIPAGSTLYTLVTQASESGMTRYVRVFAVTDGRIESVSHLAARVLGYRLTGDLELKVSGCGFDAGHEIVHDLAKVLHGNAGALSLVRL